MPRVYITKNEKLCSRLAAWVYGQMRLNNVTQSMIAERRGVSRQAIGEKLKKHKFDFEDFVTFVDLFQPDDREIRNLIGGNN